MYCHLYDCLNLMLCKNMHQKKMLQTNKFLNSIQLIFCSVHSSGCYLLQQINTDNELQLNFVHNLFSVILIVSRFLFFCLIFPFFCDDEGVSIFSFYLPSVHIERSLSLLDEQYTDMNLEFACSFIYFLLSIDTFNSQSQMGTLTTD